MAFGKSAASKGAEIGINELFGKDTGSEEAKENDQQASLEYQALSTLQTAYTQEERKRIFENNTGTSIESVY